MSAWVRGCVGAWVRGCVGGLVVAGRVEGEFAEQLSGCGMHDADVEIVDEQDDVGVAVAARRPHLSLCRSYTLRCQ